MVESQGFEPTLVDFLRARIGEDEAWVRQQEHEAIRTHRVGGASYPPGHYTRVRVDCAAKRRLLDEFEVLSSTPDARVEQRVALRWVLELHALAYAAHPDYRDQWRP